MIKLDEHPIVRDVSFDTLLELLKVIHLNQPANYRDIVEKPLDGILPVWTNQDGVIARSRRYFHLNALKVLDLVTHENKAYSISTRGYRLLEASSNTHSNQLSEEAITLFRKAILDSDYIKRNFFVLFVGCPYKDPLESGLPVAINPVPGEKTYTLRSSLWANDLVLTKVQTQGIIWGIKQWCIDLSIVDEIFIRPQKDVDENCANIIFPVNQEKAEKMSVEEFHLRLMKYLLHEKPIYKDIYSISIPLLLYRFCPGEHIPLQKAKELLLVWLKENKEAAFIESTSFPVLRAGGFKRGSAYISWRKQEDSFLKIEGKFYSRLFASASLWKSNRST